MNAAESWPLGGAERATRRPYVWSPSSGGGALPLGATQSAPRHDQSECPSRVPTTPNISRRYRSTESRVSPSALSKSRNKEPSGVVVMRPDPPRVPNILSEFDTVPVCDPWDGADPGAGKRDHVRALDSVQDSFILLRRERAGRIHDDPAGPHVPQRVPQERDLGLGDARPERQDLLATAAGQAPAHRAFTGAGRVNERRVERCLCSESHAVGSDHRSASDTETVQIRAQRRDPGVLPFVRDDQAAIPQSHRDLRGLVPGCCAEVQHTHARLQRESIDRPKSRLLLCMHPPKAIWGRAAYRGVRGEPPRIPSPPYRGRIGPSGFDRSFDRTPVHQERVAPQRPRERTCARARERVPIIDQRPVPIES